MKVKIGIWGGMHSGKTHVFWQLAPSNTFQPTSFVPERTVQRFYGNNTHPMRMCFYDKPDYQTNSEFWESKKSDISIYCIDLSNELTVDRIKQIKYEIGQFHKKNPQTRLIIAATKSNLAMDEAFETLKKMVFPLPTVTTSEEDPAMLWEQLDTVSIILRIEKMRDRFPKDSNMFTLLNHLNRELQFLPLPTRAALASEVETLIYTLTDRQAQDGFAEKPIELFLERCDEIVCGKYSVVKNILISIAIAVAVFILAACMGFFMGFSLAAWSGPGAFFAGLAVGSVSAIAVVTGAPILGIGALGVSAHMLFKPLPVETVYNEIALEARTLYV